MPERSRAAVGAGPSPAGPSPAGPSAAGPSAAVQWIGRNWSLIFLVLELALFGVFGLHFFSAENLQNILVAATTVLLLGVGETFVIISGGIDLSVGFVMGFAAVNCAKVMVLVQGAGLSDWAAILLGALAAVLIGLLPGLVNGLLVARLNVPPFLATFGMYGIAYGFSEIISENTPISGLPALTGTIGNGSLLYVLPGKFVRLFARPDGLAPLELRRVVPILPNIVVITLAFVGIFAFVLARTRFGQHTYAIGGSQDAAVRAGINVRGHLTRVYMLSSLCASVSGVIFVLRYVTGRADAGSARMLDAVVAVVIGGASLYGGTGTIRGTLVGALIIATLETGMVNLGIPTFNRYIAIGVILVVAVLIDQFFPELIEKD
ncbi:MAG: ABC transporter permease [Spirochaetales bacterium]|nr:ABC transporter permease [Spirochaetales bacterium]